MTLTHSIGHGGISTSPLPGEVFLVGDDPGYTSRADGSTGSCGVLITDPEAELDIIGLNKFEVDDDACDNPRIFTGMIANRVVSRNKPSHRVQDQRAWDTNLLDQNGYLMLRIITDARNGNRPAETDVERIAWLLDDVLPDHAINGTGGTFGANAPTAAVLAAPRNLDAADYRGQYVADVLADIGPPGNRRYFCYWDPGLEAVCLFYGLNSDYLGDATIAISNVMSDLDSTTFEPRFDANLDRDPSAVYSEVYYKYRNGTIYRQNPATVSTFLDRGIAITNDRVGLYSTASVFTDRILEKAGAERDDITCTITVPPEHVNHVLEGQRISVRFSHLPGYEAARYMHVLARTVSNDVTGLLYDIHLELSDYVGGFGTGGSGSGSPSVPFVPGTRDPDIVYAICNTVSSIGSPDRHAEGPAETNLVEGDWYWELENTAHDTAAFTEFAHLTYGGGAVTIDLLAAMGESVPGSAELQGGGGICPWPVLPNGSGTFTVPPGGTGFHFQTASQGYSAPCSAPYDDECWELRLWQGTAPIASNPVNGQQVTESIAGTTSSTTLQTNYPYWPGSLIVNGHELIPDETDPSAGEFELTTDTTGQTLIVTYQATGDPSTGATNPYPTPGSYSTPSGAPTGADYLVGTAQAGLSAEIVVGTTPGGELGNTWASPTVDATHAGSNHLQPVRKNSTGTVFERRRLNLIEGSNVTLTVADDAGNDEVDITIAASGGGSGVDVQDEGSPLTTTATTLNFTGSGVTASGSGATKTINIPGGGGALTQAYVGKNAVGASSEAATAGIVTAKKITLANDCLLTDIQVHIKMVADVAATQFFAFLYDDNGSGTLPKHLLGAWGTVRDMVLELSSTGPRDARWVSIGVGRCLTAGDYWIAWQLFDPDFHIFYDTGGSDPRMTPTNPQIGDWGLWTSSDSTKDYSIRANTIR